MKASISNVLRIAALACFAAGVLCPAGRTPAQVPSDKIIPPDAFLFLEVKNVDDLVAKFKKTSAYGLYKDPAMRKFIVPAEKKVRELIDESVRDEWKEMGVTEPPKKMVYRPKGRVVLAVRMGTRIITIPKWGRVDGEFKVVGTRRRKAPDPQVVVLADMGESAEAFGEMLDKLVAAAVDKGWQRDRQTLRGMTVTTMTSPKRARPAGAPEWMPAPRRKTFCYAFKGRTVAGATDVKLLKDVLVRMGGAEAPGFGDDSAYKDAFKALGPGADARLYLNVKTLLAFAKTMDESPKGKVDAQVRALGVDAVTGVAATAAVAPSRQEDLRVKVLVAVRGERRGIIAMLTPETRSTKPGALLAKGLAAFVVANYDLAKVYDELVKIVQAMAGVDLNMQLARVMTPTGGKGQDGRPPVDFRKDVLGHLAVPMTLTFEMARSYAAPDAAKVGFAVGVRDADALDSALGRIHDTFLGRGEKRLRKELLGTNIYLLPLDPTVFLRAAMPMGVPAPRPAGDAAPKIAFSVVGQNLMIASVDTVEQAIRSLVRGKRTESIQLDPMYRHAARFLPGEAGVFCYSNNQVGNEATWEQLRKAAREETAEPRAARGPGRRRSAAGPPAARALLAAIKKKLGLGDSLDFSALPPFERVKKYFGPTVGYVKSTDRGLLMELVAVKAPRQ